MSEWDSIEANLEHALDSLFARFIMVWNQNMDDDDAWRDFINQAKARYEKGRQQHVESASTWENWTDADFIVNITEELLDAVIYEAARMNRLVDSR